MNDKISGYPFMRTKLHRPPVPDDHIHRSELIRQLEKQSKLPLILVSAPAGYGKSTLVSCWLSGSEKPSAWLSLDENDNDLGQFLTCFVTAVQSIFPEAVHETQAILEAQVLPPIPVMAITLINELDSIEKDFIVVLDDIQCVQDKNIYNLLNLVLEHPGRSMQLVVIGRRDPTLSIASLRAKGLLTELRMRDMRFTVDEAKDFLKISMGQQFNEDVAEALVEKAEGWVTGLRLAVLAMRGHDDPGRKFVELQGSTRYVMDYLISELLDNQPSGIRHCLLSSSILNRFCAPLLDGMCQDDETPGMNVIKGGEFVNWLRTHNLFVIPLDMENHWFRYHHLFKDLLQRKMKEAMSVEEIKRLHLKASEWFESQGLITESVGHALEAEDPVRAAQIIEANRDDEFIADRWFVINRWLTMLPADIKRQRPKLLLTEAWIANMQHQMARVPMLLEQAEALLHDQAVEPSSLGELAFFHGYVIYWDGQAKLCRQYFEEAVSKLSATKSPFLGEAELMLGVARTMEGQAEPAVRALEGRINEVDSSEGQLLSRLIASLVFIHLICGDLARARIEAQRLQLVAKKFSMRLTEAWSSYMLACSYMHTGEFKAALPHFASAYAQRYVLEPMAALDALVGLALTQQFMGLDDKATETAGLLAAFAQELNAPQYMSMVHSCYARIALLQGDLRSADERARMISDMPSAGNLFMWLESPPTTRARVLIAIGSKASLVEATDLLQTIRQVSESCRFTCHTIEVTILQALALDRQGRTEEALALLEEVLSLAGPRGWIRPFVEGGQPMAELLKRLSGSDLTAHYIDQILNAFEYDDQAPLPGTSDSRALQEESFSKPSTGNLFSSKSLQPITEPLTHREQDVLELLSGRLRNKEIAEELHISAITVKSHLRNIYQKLGVEKRRQAVEKARELGILK